ncbi:MAG: hypothetical protein ACR2GX_02500 [Candidatus Dormibacteria bacterium]
MPAPIVTSQPQRSAIRSAWLISLVSVLWTAIAGATGIAIGLADGSGILVVFSAVGIVDAVGSAALVYHFGHALRHAKISEGLERTAHGIVTIGLIVVGLAAMGANAFRLVTGLGSHSSGVAAGLAAASLAVLIILSLRKRAVARIVMSGALLTDAHLSAVGALLAAMALIGIVVTQAFGWWWVDAAAAMAIGCIALVLGIVSRPRNSDDTP